MTIESSKRIVTIYLIFVGQQYWLSVITIIKTVVQPIACSIKFCFPIMLEVAKLIRIKRFANFAKIIYRYIFGSEPHIEYPNSWSVFDNGK